MVEVSITGRSQIKVTNDSVDDLGVHLSQPLGVGLNGNSPRDVLSEKTQ